MKPLFKALMLIVIGIILLVVCILFGKRWVYFYPTKVSQHAGKPKGMEDVWIEGLHGWLYTEKGSEEKRKIVIVFHGNAGHIGYRAHLLNPFKKMGVDLLLFDWSGYGMSGGSPSEDQLYSDGQKIVDWALQKGYTKDRIVLYGESIGSPVACKVASDNGIEKLVLQSGPHSISKFIWNKFPVMIAGALSLFVRNDFPTYRYLQEFEGECLIMHGDNDQLIEPDHAEELEKCNDRAELCMVSGGHNFISLDWDKIEQFIAS